MDLMRRVRAYLRARPLLADPRVEQVERSGVIPRVYLVGEFHTCKSHVQYVSDLVDALRPPVLYSESAPAAHMPKKGPRTFLDYLGPEYRPALLAAIERIEPGSGIERYVHRFAPQDQELVRAAAEQAKQADSETLAHFSERKQLLETATYLLPHAAYAMGMRALREVVRDAARPIRDEVRRACMEDPARTHELLPLQDFLALPEAGVEDPRLLEEFRVWERIGDLLTVYFVMEELRRGYYEEEGLDRTVGFSRARERYALEDRCAQAGVRIEPFDDVPAKGLLLKVKRAIARTRDPDKLARLMRTYESLSDRRDARMAQIMRGLDAPLAVTYGGRAHIGSDAPAIEALRERRVPFAAIRLRYEPGRDQAADAILYDAELLAQ